MKIIYYCTIIYFLTFALYSTSYAEDVILNQINREHKQRLANTLLYSKEPKNKKLCYVTYLASGSFGEHVTDRQARSYTGFIVEIKITETRMSLEYDNKDSKEVIELSVPFRKQLLKTTSGYISEDLGGEGVLHDMYANTIGNEVIQYLLPTGAEDWLYFTMLHYSYQKDGETDSFVKMYECYN